MVQTHSFPIEPVQQYSSLNAAIRRPREITCFSYDDTHTLRLDDSSLRYYYPPSLPADLNAGFDTFRQLDDTGDDHLDGLLDAIAAHEQSKNSKLDVDIITWRGMMTKVMTAPFSPLDSWEMNATLYQSTLYIEEHHPAKLASRAAQHSQKPAHPNAMSQDLMSYWGYKFESLSLLPAPYPTVDRSYIDSRDSHPVSNHAQYCSIVRTGFGKTKLVIGGEVDAVEAFKPADPKEGVRWIELKTTAEINSDRDVVKFERKLLKFWAQSFLLGVPKIVVGYRSPRGELRRLEELETQTIPDRVARGKRMWDGQTCINFTAAFLEWARQTITEEGTWRIRKREKVPVLEVYRVEETGTGDILSEGFKAWREGGQLDHSVKVQNGGFAGRVVGTNGHDGIATETAEDHDMDEDRPAPAPAGDDAMPPTGQGLDERKTALLAALNKAVESSLP